jgi:O-antigen/teichoic acid export membrane protein
VAHCPRVVREMVDQILASPLISRLLQGAFWSVAGAVAGRGLGLVTWMLVANPLGKTVFGELNFLLNTFSLLEKLSLFGLGVMATRYVAAHRRTDPARAGRILGLGLVSSVLLGVVMSAFIFAVAPWLSETLFDAAHLGPMLRIGCSLVALYAFGGVVEGCLAGFEAFRPIAWINLVGGAVSVPLLVYGARVAGLEGTLWMMVVAALCRVLFGYALLRRTATRCGCEITYRGIRKEVRAVLDFSIPIVCSSQTLFFGEWLGNWMLVRGPLGFGQLGIYSAAARWQQAVSFIPLNVSRALFPALTERHAARDRRSFVRMLRYYLAFCTVISAVCALGLSALSWPIMRGYGQEFAEGWSVLVLVSLTVILLPFRWVIEMIYRSLNAVWWEVLMNAAWTVVLIAGMVWFPMQGAWKLAVATLLAFLVTNVLGAAHVYLHFFRRYWTRGQEADAA